MFELTEVTYNNNPVFLRNMTSDTFLFKNQLVEKHPEYWFPKDLEPEIILDIGANIGITTLVMLEMYPGAQVYCFEPEKENFEILKKNTERFKRVKLFNFGLSDITGRCPIYASKDKTNFGGYSVIHSLEGIEDDSVNFVEIRHVREVIKDLDNHCIDLIKIDCEGSENKIIQNFPKNILRQTKIITGELHGHDDFEMLSHLRDLDFNLSYTKPDPYNRIGKFFAQHKSL